MDGSSYFRDAHHFKVDSLNLNSHSGAHNDYRRSDVRNIYQGGDGNAYHTHLDSRRQDYGNRYATTNHNRGQSYNYNAPVNHYNAPTNATYYYTTHAQGSSVINGNFTGVQYNWNPGSPMPGKPGSPRPQREQKSHSTPRSVKNARTMAASAPQGPSYRHSSPSQPSKPQSRVVPAPGGDIRTEFDATAAHYREPTFNPWANQRHDASPSIPVLSSSSQPAPLRPGDRDSTLQSKSFDTGFVGDTDTDTDSGAETDGYGLGRPALKPRRQKGSNPRRNISIGAGDCKWKNPLLV